MNTYIIIEGCIREYIITEGEEKTTNFFAEVQWVISKSNFNAQRASKHHLVKVNPHLSQTTILNSIFLHSNFNQ